MLFFNYKPIIIKQLYFFYNLNYSSTKYIILCMIHYIVSIMHMYLGIIYYEIKIPKPEAIEQFHFFKFPKFRVINY